MKQERLGGAGGTADQESDFSCERGKNFEKTPASIGSRAVETGPVASRAKEMSQLQSIREEGERGATLVRQGDNVEGGAENY